MAKQRGAKPRLIPEDRLGPLRAEVERLADESDYAFPALGRRPYYHAIAYYMMFSHLLGPLRQKLGGIDDDAALTNAYFWYRVVAEWAGRIEPGSNPLEGEMEGVEASPTYYFAEGQDMAIWNAAAEYVTRARRSGAGATRKRRAAGARAAQTKKRRAAGQKVAATRNTKQAEPGAAADRGPRAGRGS